MRIQFNRLAVERVDPNALSASCTPTNALRSMRATSGFTLVELLIGVSLALMIMTAVLTSYVTLGRNFTRSLGISSANQPTLETQSRRTLAYFAQDVRMAISLSSITSTGSLASPPKIQSLRINLPGTGASSTPTYVDYYYSSAAQTLVRTLEGGSAQTLQTNLTDLTFNYYDSSGNPYASFTNYLSGIRQLSLTFTSQAGSSTNGTLTQVYETESPRLIIRNKALLQ